MHHKEPPQWEACAPQLGKPRLATTRENLKHINKDPAQLKTNKQITAGILKMNPSLKN